MKITRQVCDVCKEIALRPKSLSLDAGMGVHSAICCSLSCQVNFANRIINLANTQVTLIGVTTDGQQ